MGNTVEMAGGDMYLSLFLCFLWKLILEITSFGKFLWIPMWVASEEFVSLVDTP